MIQLSQLLKDKIIRICLVLLGLGVMSYLAIGSWVGKIESTEKRLNLAWQTLTENCQRRVQLLPEFAKLTQTILPNDLLLFATQSFDAAQKNSPTMQVLTNPAAMQLFVKTQQDVFLALKNMDTIAAQHPEIAQNRHYHMLKMQWQLLEQQIAFGTVAVNKEVASYNFHLSGVLTSPANKILLHHKLKIALPQN